MKLREYIEKNHCVNDLIYLGGIGNQASGFIYIGIAAMIPSEYYDIEVVETYPHTIDQPGTNVLIDQDMRGSYWFYGEANPRAKKPTCEINCSDEMLEGLLIGIAKQAVADYRTYLRNKVNDHLAKNENQITDEAYAKVAVRCRKHPEYTFLMDSAVGKQAMQMVEDEELVYLRHPEVLDISNYEKRSRVIMDYCYEIAKARLHKNESKYVYASIKGKGVNT